MAGASGANRDFPAVGPALLFCPADRPERYPKAAAAADAVILDLEDAVAPDDKASAREALIGSDLDPATTVVRLNPVGTAEFDRDLAALARTSYTTVMLAKAETPQDLNRVDGLHVIALCESPLGVRNAGLLADHPSVVALMWGAEDLVAALGGNSSRRADGRYRDFARYARSHVLVNAVSAGKIAFDTVHLDIADEAGLQEEARDAAASGFAGTVCIHPDRSASSGPRIARQQNPRSGPPTCLLRQMSPATGCSASTGRWSTSRCCVRPVAF